MAPALIDGYPSFEYHAGVMSEPTTVDLFCGAGGISHGFEQAGFAVLAGIDNDADSLATFQINHPSSRTLCADLSAEPPATIGELLTLRRGELDCLAGGPPCQGFSRNRAFRHHNGSFVDDPRNHLYWHFFEYVAFLRPRTVLVENVPEILIKEDGFFRDAVFEKFHRLGYSADAHVLNAADYGVPQRRRRAFFLASRDTAPPSFPLALTRPGRRAGRRTPSSPEFYGDDRSPSLCLPLFEPLPEGPSVWDAISDLFGSYAAELSGKAPYATPPNTTYQRERRGCSSEICNHFPWPLTSRQLERVRHLSQGQGVLHLPDHLQTKSGYGSAYRRLQADAQALTITTWMFHPGSGMFTHPHEDRVLTIREAARLQSFQDCFVFAGRYHSQCKQVGNSVAPLVAKAIAESVRAALNLAGANCGHRV